MSNETRKKEKAVRKLDKAVRKAVDKGVSQSVVESTVDAAITKAAKVPAKKPATLENSDPDAEQVTSKPPAAKLKKLPRKRKPPTLTLKRGKNSLSE
jgi:hypothetical protein